MSWKDLGFNKSLSREQIRNIPEIIGEDEVSKTISQISGSYIRGGVITSANGALQIDLNEGVIRFSNTDKQGIVLSGSGNEIIINDGSHDRVWLDGSLGKIKVSREGYDVKTATTSQLIMSSDFAYVRETWLQMHPQWDNSWTNLNTYQDVSGALNSINFDDWPDHSWYFEMIGKTDAGTGYYQLYNVTTSSIVTGSEISTSSTVPIRLRSNSITKPSGTNVIKIQHKIVGGNGSTEYVNSIMSRSVFRID